MNNENVRTRFAPSPTGYMHIGNLRTALYAFLFAKHCEGAFVLRIEDTDKKRYVDGSIEVIYNTLAQTHLKHDEGPDIGGKYGPYVQSERMEIYKKYANELVEKGFAYYCFCEKNEDAEDSENVTGYNRKCRNLTKVQIDNNLKAGLSYVIRQKIPFEGSTTFHDEVYGDITVENATLDDQILLKSDGMPTYNFANVVDDHLMNISHVMRGKEYISSTPKYQLLYEAFGWKSPKVVHLSTIMGKNADGSVSKLSKRHGAVSFSQLISEGFLIDAVLNYIALLGWSPKQEREIFSLDELIEIFNIEGLVKTDAIFDYKKLEWMNAEYIKKLDRNEFLKLSQQYVLDLPDFIKQKWDFVSNLMQSRISKFSDIKGMLEFLWIYEDFDLELLLNKKNKVTLDDALLCLVKVLPALKNIQNWDCNTLNKIMEDFAQQMDVKLGFLMWPVRIAVSGQAVTPGGSGEVMYILGKDESIRRIEKTISRLQK